MTPIIPLTKIGFFNPGRLTDEEIEQSFIARVSFFQFIFNKIFSEKPNSIPQHHLIIGQRGMGKTSLLMRIAAELRKLPYKETFIALTFPEEQYNVDRLSKFWLNCLDALADALDKEHKTAELNELDAEISRLSKEQALDANSVYETFKKWLGNIKRRPVLLVDNLNLIFSKISKEEQHQLRAILISEDAPILIGASATAIEETLNYQAPFYDAFQINYLKKLTFQESIDVLVNLARITGNPSFENTIYLKKGRIEALYDLTGGTPRTLAILFPLIQNGFSEDIQNDLDALLDLVTPLYKARFEELAPQLQVVLDAVALHWDPATLEQIRDITFLENQQISPQLKRLVDAGWLQKLDAYKAKGGAYELSERFFNVWYLMRRSSRRQKRELYCLTKFLESFYGNDLHEIAKTRLTSNQENTNQIALDLALADALKDKMYSDKLKNKSYNAILNLSWNNPDVLKNFFVPDDVKFQKAKELFEVLELQLEKQEFEEASATGKKIISIYEKTANVWSILGILYTDKLGNYQDAEKAFYKAIEIDGENAVPWNGLGTLYADKLAKYTEAEKAFLNSTLLDNKQALPWKALGMLYLTNLHRYEDAEKAWLNAAALDSKDADLWSNLGILYLDKFDKFEEAEQAFRNAIRLNKKDPLPWNWLGILYADKLQRYQDAEKAWFKAIELDESNPSPWCNLGILYADKLSKPQEAEQAFLRSNSLNKSDARPLNGLGSLYSNEFGKYKEAEEAYLAAIALDTTNTLYLFNLGILYNKLGKYQDAETAWLKTISLDKKNALQWFSLSTLYKENLYKYKESEQALLTAISLDKTDINKWNYLGSLYHDSLHNYRKAEDAYLEAITLSTSNLYPKINLVFLWRDKLKKIAEAKELFNNIPKSDELADSYSLNQALFAYYDNNVGIAEKHLKEALKSIGETLPLNTVDDWYRSAAVIVKLGYSDNLLRVFHNTGHDIILKPFYIAIEAISKKEDELFFNSIAAEIREPAKKIMALIKNHLD